MIFLTFIISFFGFVWACAALDVCDDAGIGTSDCKPDGHGVQIVGYLIIYLLLICIQLLAVYALFTLKTFDFRRF